MAKYDIYNKKRNFRHTPYRKLQPLPISDKHQSSISINFIVKLFILRIIRSNDEFDSIFIIIDRKGKMAYFMPYREVINTEEFVSFFYRIIITRYKIPAEIISDKDKLFISKFQTSLIIRLGVEYKLSTSYHLQTDRQTERTNQTLEVYLISYVDIQ